MLSNERHEHLHTLSSTLAESNVFLIIPPPQTKFGGYIGITLSIRPCTLKVQLLLNRLLDFYETLHICSTLPADMHEGISLLSKI